MKTHERTLDGKRTVVVDVSGVDSVDVRFVQSLMALRERMREEGAAAIELMGATPRLRRTLEVTGLARMFS